MDGLNALFPLVPSVANPSVPHDAIMYSTYTHDPYCMTYLSEHVLHIKYWSPISQNSAWPLSPARSTPSATRHRPRPARMGCQNCHDAALERCSGPGIRCGGRQRAVGNGWSGTVGRGQSVGDGRSVTVDRRGSTAAPGDKHGRVDGRGTLIIMGGKETKIKI